MTRLRRIDVRPCSLLVVSGHENRDDPLHEVQGVPQLRGARGRRLLEGVLPRTRYDFTSLGEVYLLDFDEAEEIEVIRPAEPWG
jgi:hypothetical protein